MMNLGEHFGRDEGSRHSEWLRQKKWFIKARNDRKRRLELEDRAEDDGLAFTVAMATPDQLEFFERKLEAYDSAIVLALMENTHALDEVRNRIDQMLAKAHILEDGRRVFKSQDGTFVIDEHGQDVSNDEVDFDAISPHRPTAEQFLEALNEESDLLQDRERIIEFQDKVDAAKDRVAGTEFTEAELDELDAELSAVMPKSVKMHLPSEFNPTTNAPDIQKEFRATTPIPTNIPKSGHATMKLDG
jgi:hypothetical protein